MEVTGERETEVITRAKIKVVTKQAGLHRLADYTPRLKILILDGSWVDSLRDLGSSLKFLENLSLVKCGLKSLDGVWGFPMLATLIASDNSISDVSTCSGVRKLEVLDLRNNQIVDLQAFIFLRNCKRLRVLDVAGNRFLDYKNNILSLLPQVRILNGEEIKMADDATESQESSGEDSDFASTDEDSIFLFNDDEKNASSALRKIEDISAAGDKSSIVSSLNEPGAKFVEKEINLDPSSSSIYLTNHELDTISMFAPSSNDDPIDVMKNVIGDCNRNLENISSKLSSGRAICGNLAASLRSRNATKNPFTLSTARSSFFEHNIPEDSNSHKMIA